MLKKALYFAVGLLIFFGNGVSTILKAQQQASITSILQRNDAEAIPVVDYTSIGKTTDAARILKNRRFNNYNFVEREAGPRVTTISRDVALGSSDLPAGKSSLIVEGKVIESNAFLSEDGSGIYCEFTISINEIIKANPNINLARGETVSARRAGGRVRYPSGQIVRYQLQGRGTPEKGKTYFFFLTAAAPGTPAILTAYELNGNRIFPLDGALANGMGFGDSNYDRHIGENIERFKRSVEIALRGEYDRFERFPYKMLKPAISTF